jgi:uncharacterized protein DUF6600
MFLPTVPALVAVSVLALLMGCGNPSSESANQTSEETQASADVAQGGEPTAEEEDEAKDYASDQEAEGYASEQDEAGEDEASGYDGQDAPPDAGDQRVPRHVATNDVGAGVRGDVGMFYDALDRDGSWVHHPDYSYVWIPSRMGPGWRPYQEGRWVWTNDYGWYWESDEPFAWAVYHYGRWDYDPDYGWFWVPGDTWAPAWVTWRFGGGHVGWAPVAPDRPGFAAGAPRRYAPPIAESWVFVQARNFDDPDLGQYTLPPSRIGPSLAAATDIRTPRYERGRMLNPGAPPDEIQPIIGRRVAMRSIVYVGDRDDMFDEGPGRRVGVYRPRIGAVEIRRAPASVVDVGRTRRVMVREYAQGPSRSAYDGPSAALLDVLDGNERRSLLEVRLTAKQDAVDRRIEKLRKERAALLQARREEAAHLEAKLEKERKKAMAERRRNQEIIREQKRERAAAVKFETQVKSKEAVAPVEPAQAKAGAPAAADTEILPAKDQPNPEKAPAPEPVPAAAPTPPTAPVPAEATQAPAPQAPARQEAVAKPEPAPEAKPSPEAVPEAEPSATGAVDETPRKKKRQKPDSAKADRPAPPPPEAQPADSAPPPAAATAPEDEGRKKKAAKPPVEAPAEAAVEPAAPAPPATPTPAMEQPPIAPAAQMEAAPKKRKQVAPAVPEAVMEAPSSPAAGEIAVPGQAPELTTPPPQ